MARTGSGRGVDGRWRGLQRAALALSLILSALLTAAALRAPDHHWLAWISFLPVLLAVRTLRWPAAAAAGGLWGACLYASCVAGPIPLIERSSWSLALLTAIPALYAGLGTLPTRAIGFKLLVLALGWVLVEAALQPLGLQRGLLAGLHAESSHGHWIARLIGYIFVALVVVSANATLLAILNRVRLRFPARTVVVAAPRPGAQPSPHAAVPCQFLAFRETCPRAPPVRTAAVDSLTRVVRGGATGGERLFFRNDKRWQNCF